MNNWSIEDLKRKGLVQKNYGAYIPVKSLVSKKVSKLPNLLERPDNKVIGNKKVKNATKIVVDGVKFDSHLEYYMYKLLRGAGIDFELKKTYILQVKFKYNGEAIRAIKIIVDFYLESFNMVVDTKGFSTDVSKLKYKMLKASFIKWNDCPKIEMPSTEKECDLLLNRLIYDKAKITAKG